MSKYWDILLAEWRKQGRDGFTLPFIIGAQKYLLKATTAQTISELLIDIATSDKAKVYVKYCITTEEIILGIYDENTSKLQGGFPRYKETDQSQLFLTSFLANLGNNVEHVALTLAERYDPHIQKEEFSKHEDRTWGNFKEAEITFIKSSFKSSGLTE